VTVTNVPTGPALGLMLVMFGLNVVTVKPTALLVSPATVTMTPPVVAPAGTDTPIIVALQLVGDAVVPLNITVLFACVEPKFVPVMVTDVLTAPELGDKLLMKGCGVPPLPPPPIS